MIPGVCLDVTEINLQEKKRRGDDLIRNTRDNHTNHPYVIRFISTISMSGRIFSDVCTYRIGKLHMSDRVISSAFGGSDWRACRAINT